MKELVERIMFSLNSGSESSRSEDNVGHATVLPGQLRRKPMMISRALRTMVRTGLGLILLWVGAVFWLGLLYWAVPPVSTLMIGRWATLRPVERNFVPIEAISPNLPLAVMSSEDSRFCTHAGVDWDAIREVVEAADEDGPARGASTIPMQTAKNLFLWNGRSYLRKALELPVALYLDLIWSKQHMMQTYLNIAEWGDGIFGAEAAAQRYFGKTARNLTRREAALLAAALPNPVVRNPGRPSPGHARIAARIMARMASAAPVSDCLKG
jgi:monofunctional biosynthetic peptidoglycan transglycosylase